MCGIVLATGPNAVSVGVALQKKLLHRGYDSAGALIDGDIPKHWCPPDSEETLEEFLEGLLSYDKSSKRNSILLHNRWSTNGKPCLRNTHPVGNKSLGFLVHNGIVANFAALRQKYQPNEESDTHLVHHLMSSVYKSYNGAMEDIEGDNVFVWYLASHWVILTGNVSVYYAERDDLKVLCSEPTPLIEEGFTTIKMLQNKKGGTGKFLFSEISGLDLPVIEVKGIRKPAKVTTMKEEIEEQAHFSLDFDIISLNDVHFFGCGSSYYAGLFIKEYLDVVDGYCNKKVTQASLLKEQLRKEYGHGNTHDRNWFALSQSGESKDVIDCARLLTEDDCRVWSLTNNPNSSLARMSDQHFSLETKCGTEYAVAAIKTFTSMCLSFMSNEDRRYWGEKVAENLKQDMEVIDKTDSFPFDKIFFFGNGTAYPIALESALKMIEVAGIPAFAMPAAEVKHGNIALIDDKTFCVFLNSIPPEGQEDNDAQVKARGARTYWLHSTRREFASDKHFAREGVMDLMNVLFAQYLAYKMAVHKGLNPDRPAQLAKTITV